MQIFFQRPLLDCTKTCRNKVRIFLVSFYSASCLSLGDLVQRCLGQPVDLLAPWPSAAVIPRRRSTAVHFQSVERRVQRNLETFDWMNCQAVVTFFFFMLTRRRGLGERETKFSTGVTVTAPTTMHAEERQHESSQRHSEVRAGRLSSRFRLRAYRTVLRLQWIPFLMFFFLFEKIKSPACPILFKFSGELRYGLIYSPLYEWDP